MLWCLADGACKQQECYQIAFLCRPKNQQACMPRYYQCLLLKRLSICTHTLLRPGMQWPILVLRKKQAASVGAVLPAQSKCMAWHNALAKPLQGDNAATALKLGTTAVQPLTKHRRSSKTTAKMATCTATLSHIQRLQTQETISRRMGMNQQLATKKPDQSPACCGGSAWCATQQRHQGTG